MIKHRTLNLTRSFRLTSHTFHRRATDVTDTDSSANCSQTSTDTSAHNCVADVQ